MKHWMPRFVCCLCVAVAAFFLVRSSPQGAPEASPPIPQEPPPQVQPAPPRKARVAPPASPRAVATEAPPAKQERNREPRFHPRDPKEWQGMLIDLSVAPTCERTELCGFATVCRDNRCGPCQADSECLSGEVCVLDHCVRREQAHCRSRSDCSEPDSMCVLSGYSADPRSNEEMKAECISASSGQGKPASGEALKIDDRPLSMEQEMLRELRN